MSSSGSPAGPTPISQSRNDGNLEKVGVDLARHLVDADGRDRLVAGDQFAIDADDTVLIAGGAGEVAAVAGEGEARRLHRLEAAEEAGDGEAVAVVGLLPAALDVVVDAV